MKIPQLCATAPASEADVQRFFQYVRESESGCWEWTGGKTRSGYGHFAVRRKQYVAHRFAYMAFVGPITDSRFVCHQCDNRPCVNPAHFFLGTQRANIRNMVAKGRMDYSRRRRQALCHNGHPFTDEATVIQPGGKYRPYRRCAICREASRKARVVRDRTARHVSPHCANGHEMTPENTWINSGGQKWCRICRAEAHRKAWATRKQAPGIFGAKDDEAR